MGQVLIRYEKTIVGTASNLSGKMRKVSLIARERYNLCGHTRQWSMCGSERLIPRDHHKNDENLFDYSQTKERKKKRFQKRFYVQTLQIISSFRYRKIQYVPDARDFWGSDENHRNTLSTLFRLNDKTMF
jgi:hypothetical protein